MRKSQPVGPWLVLCGCLGLAGCQIPADIINPSLLTGLGIDAASIRPSQGTIIIAFHNSARSTADFFVAVSDNPNDPLSNVKAVPVSDVAAGTTVNRVLDCPVGVITPGLPQANNQTGTAAVNVQVGMGVAVVYNGSTIISGRDFVCGDVIEIELLQNGQGTAATDYSIRVSIHAGR